MRTVYPTRTHSPTPAAELNTSTRNKCASATAIALRCGSGECNQSRTSPPDPMRNRNYWRLADLIAYETSKRERAMPPNKERGLAGSYPGGLESHAVETEPSKHSKRPSQDQVRVVDTDTGRMLVAGVIDRASSRRMISPSWSFAPPAPMSSAASRSRR